MCGARNMPRWRQRPGRRALWASNLVGSAAKRAKEADGQDDAIARIEGGGTVPTMEMLARLARATGIPVHLAAAGVADVEIGAA